MAIRVGILGCGAIARAAHLPSLARERDVVVAALADQDSASLTAARMVAPGARPAADYREVLAMPDVDAVIVALPPALHADAAITALETGKHVYIEKPLATSLADATRVVAAAKGTRLTAMMGFNYRFNPLTLEAKARIAFGEIGDVVMVRTVFSTAARSLPAWKQRRDSGGGALLDLAVHHIDLIPFLVTASISSVSSTIASLNSEHDCIALQLSLTSGVNAHHFCAFTSVDEDRVEVYGTEGCLVVDRYGSLRIDVRPTGPRGALGGAVENILGQIVSLRYGARKRRAPLHEPSFPAAIGAFVRSIRDRTPVEPDVRDGLRAAEVIDAAERSAQTGRRIDVDSTDIQGDAERR